MTQPLIAVVDDDPAMLQTTAELLTDEGYQVSSWSEGKTAYEWILQQQPDLAIIDLRMEHPKAGWLIIHMLRLDPRTAELPVLLCTADSEYVRNAISALREKHSDVLVKPFSADDLLAKIAVLLNTAPAPTAATEHAPERKRLRVMSGLIRAARRRLMDILRRLGFARRSA